MNLILRSLYFILILILISSCSSSRHSISEKYINKETINERPSSRTISGVQMRDEVLIHAIQHVGRNYRYGGKSPRTGFDCSGLVSYAYGKAGIQVKGASYQQARNGSWKSRS